MNLLCFVLIVVGFNLITPLPTWYWAAFGITYVVSGVLNCYRCNQSERRHDELRKLLSKKP